MTRDAEVLKSFSIIQLCSGPYGTLSGSRIFLAKSDLDLCDGRTIKITSHEAHTGDKASNNVAGFLERVLVKSRNNQDKQPGFLVGWALGHNVADIVTLMEDGRVR